MDSEPYLFPNRVMAANQSVHAAPISRRSTSEARLSALRRQGSSVVVQLPGMRLPLLESTLSGNTLSAPPTAPPSSRSIGFNTRPSTPAYGRVQGLSARTASFQSYATTCGCSTAVSSTSTPTVTPALSFRESSAFTSNYYSKGQRVGDSLDLLTGMPEPLQTSSESHCGKSRAPSAMRRVQSDSGPFSRCPEAKIDIGAQAWSKLALPMRHSVGAANSANGSISSRDHIMSNRSVTFHDDDSPSNGIQRLGTAFLHVADILHSPTALCEGDDVLAKVGTVPIMSSRSVRFQDNGSPSNRIQRMGTAVLHVADLLWSPVAHRECNYDIPEVGPDPMMSSRSVTFQNDDSPSNNIQRMGTAFLRIADMLQPCTSLGKGDDEGTEEGDFPSTQRAVTFQDEYFPSNGIQRSGTGFVRCGELLRS